MKLHRKKAINKNYLLLLIGQTISQLGSSMTSFAVVIWAYSSTGKVLSSSLLAVCSAVPYLLISLFGGAVADDMNKKKIMLFCDSVAAIGSLAILLCCYMNCLEIWILCIINIVSGFMNAFQAPASQVAITLLVEKKDYIKHPKPNGYRSLHLIVSVPVFFSRQKRQIKVEVQIRTIAMDFWASLEHQMKYKREIPDQQHIVAQLKSCAEDIARVDMEMMNIRRRLEESVDEPTEDDLLIARLKKLDTPIL